MIYLRRIFMVSAAIVAIHMQGCGCDDDKKYYPPQQDNSFTVNGAASKGVLQGFQVSVHKFDSGLLDPIPVSSVITDNFGRYTIEIPNIYISKPLLYRVTPQASGSMMKCDLVGGCGENVNFGQSLPVSGNDFKLDAVVSDPKDNSVTNISVFTDMAASLVLDSNADSNEDVQALIALSNSRVANRLGIAGNITEIPVIDLTDNTAVTNAVNNGNALHVRYAAINAAIISAVRSDNPNASLAEALRLFVDKYVEKGLAGNVSIDEETGWGEILEYARALLVQVQTNLGVNSLANLSGLIEGLIADAQLANSETSDGYDRGTASQTAGATGIEKAKAMVQDLRDFAFSIGNTSTSGGTIGSISDDFTVQVEAAQMASSEDAAHLMEALAMAASAIDDASRAHDGNPSLTTYTSDDGVTVTITSSVENSTEFSVEQTIEIMSDAGELPVEVELTAINAVTMADAEQQNSSGMTANGSYEVAGSAQTSVLTMMVLDGSSVSVTDMATVEVMSEQSPQLSETQTLEAFDLNLMVSIAQRNTNDPITLKGNLTASLTDIMVKDTSSTNDISTSEISEIRMGIASLKISGEIGNATGESASFSLSVSGDATGVSFVDSWVNGNQTSTGETANNFADLFGSLAFTARLTGIPSVVVMNYTVARTGLESGDNGLTVKYPGKLFRFNMAVEDGEPTGNLTITNQDGVVLTAQEVIVNGESRLQGNITYGGVQYATITEEDLVVISFIDGYSVSLM